MGTNDAVWSPYHPSKARSKDASPARLVDPTLRVFTDQQEDGWHGSDSESNMHPRRVVRSGTVRLFRWSDSLSKYLRKRTDVLVGADHVSFCSNLLRKKVIFSKAEVQHKMEAM
jgi:hypothetical protein